MVEVSEGKSANQLFFEERVKALYYGVIIRAALMREGLGKPEKLHKIHINLRCKLAAHVGVY